MKAPRKLAVLCAAFFAVFLLLTVGTALPQETSTANTTPAVQTVTALSKAETQALLYKYNSLSFKYRRTADGYAHNLGKHVSHAPFAPTSSVKYAEARAILWRKTAISYRTQWEVQLQLFAKADTDFHLALKLAASHYGVQYSWLHSCAHSEGHIHGYRNYPGTLRPNKSRGIDPFEMNKGGSGAGGWMQFMSGTFYSPVYKYARAVVPAKYRKWDSRVGQAYLAAYLFKTEGSGQWTGSGC